VNSALNACDAPNREVCVLVTTDEDVRRLNLQFRHLDEATDVLSFPAGDFPGAPLGDIAISGPYAARQAHARGVAVTHELAYLAIHGVLHLLGWSDESESERARMIAEMNRIALLAGLKPDPDWCSLLHHEAGL